jgi:hypothetical protein
MDPFADLRWEKKPMGYGSVTVQLDKKTQLAI